MSQEKRLTVTEKDLQGVVRTSLDSPQPTEAQLGRRQKNNAIIKQMGLPVLESLPVVEDESTIKPRSMDEIARRSLAVAFCAVKGEANDQALVQRLVVKFSAASYFSPEEKAFIENADPSEQDRANFAWRYECQHVLLWALGYLDKLAPPNEICDVPGETAIIAKVGPKGYFTGAKPRAMTEILDAADLYYRLHWATTDLRLKGKKSEAANEEIIAERHRALNWLIRYMNQEWDDVTTDT